LFVAREFSQERSRARFRGQPTGFRRRAICDCSCSDNSGLGGAAFCGCGGRLGLHRRGAGYSGGGLGSVQLTRARLGDDVRSVHIERRNLAVRFELVSSRFRKRYVAFRHPDRMDVGAVPAFHVEAASFRQGDFRLFEWRAARLECGRVGFGLLKRGFGSEQPWAGIGRRHAPADGE
jgi:hypothetical protein